MSCHEILVQTSGKTPYVPVDTVHTLSVILSCNMSNSSSCLQKNLRFASQALLAQMFTCVGVSYCNQCTSVVLLCVPVWHLSRGAFQASVQDTMLPIGTSFSLLDGANLFLYHPHMVNAHAWEPCKVSGCMIINMLLPATRIPACADVNGVSTSDVLSGSLGSDLFAELVLFVQFHPDCQTQRDWRRSLCCAPSQHQPAHSGRQSGFDYTKRFRHLWWCSNRC